MISLWYVLTKKLMKQGHFGNSKDIQVSINWEAHINILIRYFLQELFEWKINTKYKLKIML